MNISATQEKVKDLIKELKDCDNIKKRVDIQEQISGYIVFLMSEEAEAHGDYKRAYMTRKTAEAQSIYESEESTTKAKEAAPYICKEDRKKETESEIVYENLRLFRMAVQGHLDTLMQKTSFLKHEYSKTGGDYIPVYTNDDNPFQNKNL